MWPGSKFPKQICRVNTRLTKFETQVTTPSSRQAWFHIVLNVERDGPTHLAYKLSSMPTEMDDGNVEVFRPDMEEGNRNSKGVMEVFMVNKLVYLKNLATYVNFHWYKYRLHYVHQKTNIF